MGGIKLPPCPKCGATAYLAKTSVDGNFMGYSVGCPRYHIGDGIHGVNSYEDNQKRAYSLHGFVFKNAAIKAWKTRCENDR